MRTTSLLSFLLLCGAWSGALAFYPSSCRTQRCQLEMKRGRGSFQKEGAVGGFASGGGSRKKKSSTSAAGAGSKVRRDINWCPMPSGQSLPKKRDEIGLLDTNLPTLKNGATNPTGAVAVVTASVNEQTYCFASSCPSCQIPLTKAKVLPPTESTDPHPRVVCSFCQSTYSLKDGQPLEGEEAGSSGGMFSGIVKNVFSAQSSGSLPMYKLGQKGNKDLVIAVD